MLQSGFSEGLFPNMPDKQYHALQYASNSFMSSLADVYPEEAQYNRLNPKEPTTQQKFGTATHFAILQPDLLEKVYLVAPVCSAIVKSTGKPCTASSTVLSKDGQWLCGTHSRSTELDPVQPEFIDQKDFDAVRLIRDKVWKDTRARELLEICTEREVAMLFVDPLTGMKCKAKLDALGRSAGMITDVKTTADLRLFHKSFYDWGYHRQSAFYTFGGTVLHQKGIIDCAMDIFNFIVVDKSPPYVIGVFNTPDDQFELGMQQLRPLMNLCAKCESSGIWPGHGWTWAGEKAIIEEIRIPAYGVREIERQSYLGDL